MTVTAIQTNLRPISVIGLTPPKSLHGPGPAPMLQWIEIALLVVDPLYQRDISRLGAVNVQRIAEGFRWSKFAPVVVAPIEGGLFSIVDGQHRTTAALLRGHDRVPCQVVQMSPTEQAEAFAAINGTITRIAAYQIYYARIAGQDPEAIELQDILTAAEVKIPRRNVTGKNLKQGETTAVGILFECLKSYGRDTLITALQAITMTGDGNPGMLRAYLIIALCDVFSRHKDWRDSGERLLRHMDSFDFIEAWDQAIKERSTVPSITMPALLSGKIEAHLENALAAMAA